MLLKAGIVQEKKEWEEEKSKIKALEIKDDPIYKINVAGRIF